MKVVGLIHVDWEENELHVGTEVYPIDAREAAVRCWNGACELAHSETEILWGLFGLPRAEGSDPESCFRLC